MNRIIYSVTNSENDPTDREWNLINSSINGLPKYFTNADDRSYGLRALVQQFPVVLRTLEKFQAPHLLDLGCGANPPIDGPEFQPWLATVMSFLGYAVTGVDRGSNEDAKYNHHQVDLSIPNSLSFLPDHSVDIINASGFYSSPSLNISGMELSKILDPQIERILKPNGFFLVRNY